MFCYGCCIGPTTHFEDLAWPGLSTVLEPSDRLLTVRDAKSLASAYNNLIDDARAQADVEALVLLHDDVVLHDRNFAPRARRVLRDPGVGVVGVVGASDLCNMSFWDGRTAKGRVWDGARFLDFGPPAGEVDAVDGLLMVLSPAALETVRFDETTFTGFHGYDVDYCFSCRAAGLRVVVEPFVLYHRSTGDMSSGSYADARAAFERKWGGELSRPSALTRLLPDPVRRSEVRNRTADVRSALQGRLAGTRRRAVASCGPALHRVSLRLGMVKPTPTNTGNGGRPDVEAAASPRRPPCKECLLCGQPMEAKPGGLPLVSCRRCQLLATWPAPRTDDSSSDLFDRSYSGQRSSRRRQWEHEAKQRLAWVETWAPDGILLEVGCATGEFVEQATAVGYEAIGVEPSKWAADIARRSGANVICGDLADWAADYAGFTIDGMAMFHVLEHLEDPLELLRQSRSVLADDGKLFIEVPNASSEAAISLDASWVGWEFRFHHWHFTPSSMQALLGRAGLEILELREVTARVYADRTTWGRSRAENWAAGDGTPNADYLRIVAGHPGKARRPVVNSDLTSVGAH